MPGFDLLENYIQNLEALLRRNWSRTVSSSTIPPRAEPTGTTQTSTEEMACTLHEFFVPTVTNMPTGPVVDTAEKNFELRTSLITIV